MEFYWGYANPNFLPTICSKEVSENPLKMSKNCINSQENAKPRKPPTRHGRAGTHGCPCTSARVAVHPRTAVRPCTRAQPCVRRTAARAPSCAAGHVSARGAQPCTPVRSPVFLCLAILGAPDFLEPLIFLEIAREVFFSIETRWFLLKWRTSAF